MNIALGMSRVRPAWARATHGIWQILGGVDIRTKILGIVLVMTAVLGLSVTWQVRTVMQRVFIGELENRGLSVASDLAARSIDPILLSDTYSLYLLIHETVANHPDAIYAFVLDGNGRVLAHTFGDLGFPMGLLTSLQGEQSIFHKDIPLVHVRYLSDGIIVHDFTAPIFPERGDVVRLGLSESRLTGIVNGTTRQMLLTTLLVVLVGIAAAMALTWLLTRPILSLVATAQRIGHGDLAARAEPWANDEIGALAHAFNQMVEELEAGHRAIAEKEQARTQLLQKLITAQEEERRRIARELHDGVGQVLTSLIVGNQMAAELVSATNPALAAKNYELAQVAAETLHDVRLLSRQLRPSLLDDLGLAAALERYREDFARLYPTLTVELHCELGERLPGPVEITLYRILQEAMTNAARHSGATMVGVLVQRRETDVRAIVEDNGHGFDPNAARKAARSVGLHAMLERAELIGGHFDIESNRDGTTVYVEIPLQGNSVP